MAPGTITTIKRISATPQKFSILIPSWNNLPYLKLCIESIRKNSHFQNQVIVHVNEGVDGTLDWLAVQPDISYTHSPQNIGVCYALNVTRDIVTTDYILYMNDDMYACPSWDLELWKEIEQIGHNLFFLSATTIEPAKPHKAVINAGFGTSIQNFEETRLLSTFNEPEHNDWQGSTWPPNVVHKQVWDLVGGYSTEFSPGMYSDPDFSMKLWKAGVRLFKGVAASRVYHFGSVSVNRVKRNKGYYTFIAKWGMTSSTFTKYYLHRSDQFTGPLAEPALSAFIKMKNTFKRLSLLFSYNNY